MRTKCAISDAFVRDCVFAYCASVAQYLRVFPISPIVPHYSPIVLDYAITQYRTNASVIAHLVRIMCSGLNCNTHPWQLCIRSPTLCLSVVSSGEDLAAQFRHPAAAHHAREPLLQGDPGGPPLQRRTQQERVPHVRVAQTVSGPVPSRSVPPARRQLGGYNDQLLSINVYFSILFRSC